MSGKESTSRTDANETTADDENVNECPECGGTLTTDHQRGEQICAQCGLVADSDRIDRGPEWREFDEQDRAERSRVGPPTTETRHDKGLSTTIDWKDTDAHGNQLDSKTRQKMRRLRTWNERFRTRDSRERNLQQALGEIDRMGSALGLPDHVREMASVTYRRALEEDLLPGRSVEGVATACLYAAARQSNVPRSLDEFDAVSRVERNAVGRTYRYVARELGLAVEPASPDDYVGRFVSELDLDTDIEYEAYDLLETAKENRLTDGRSPVSLAAAAVYAAALLAEADVTQREMEAATDVSQVTIRERYRELLKADEDTLL